MSDDLTRRTFVQGVAAAGALLPAASAAAEAPGRDRAADLAGTSHAAFGAPALDVVPVACAVNGEARAFDVRPAETLLDVLRDRLDLTGTKRGCGHGACGACTVTVDGTTRASCLLPATAADGREVVTIEGLSGDGLHPVQRAFLAEDALQCGFCTPGFVVEAIALYDRRRAAGLTGEPTRAEIEAALAGHLCRCGAYVGIHRAVAAACAGRYDEADPPFPRREAAEKVTGRAVYTVDVRLPGMLVGRILRSPHARARLLAVDPSGALALPGVHAVADLLHGTRRVRFAGQEILAVAADDDATARAALGRVRVEYDVLEPVVDRRDAEAAGAPPVHHVLADDWIKAAEVSVFPGPTRGNVRGPVVTTSWRPEAVPGVLRDNPVSAETYRAHAQSHAPLEPHACVAHWPGPRRLEVYVSTQSVTDVAEDLAVRFGLPREDVVVRAEHIGGAFGAKALLTMETVAAAELARVAGRPVAVVLDRAEEMVAGGYRPAVDLDLELAAGEDGPAAVRARARTMGGVAVGSVSAAMLRFPYVRGRPPKDLRDFDVFTNDSPAAPLRAPGGPQAYWALEQAVDRVAHARGVDPLALREAWDAGHLRARLYPWARTIEAWSGRGPVGAEAGRYRRGVGLAAATWFYLVEPRVRVRVSSSPDGFAVACAAQDFGNGIRTVLARALAAPLGISPGDVTVELGHSDLPIGPHSSGSRSTASVVPGVLHGLEQLLPRLRRAADRAFGGGPCTPAPGGLAGADPDDPGRVVPWSEVLARVPPLSVIGRRRPDPGGMYFPFAITGVNSGMLTTGALQCTEVEVDTRLGSVRVLRSWTGLAVGRRVAPALARSQVQGGLLMGMGYALFEERRRDPHYGFVLTRGLEDYRVPTLADVPELNIHFDDTPLESARGGLAGLAELPVVAMPASIGNALHHALGVRFHNLPLRPWAVLEALR